MGEIHLRDPSCLSECEQPGHQVPPGLTRLKRPLCFRRSELGQKTRVVPDRDTLAEVIPQKATRAGPLASARWWCVQHRCIAQPWPARSSTRHTHTPNPLGATNQRPFPLSATGEQTVVTIGGCSSSDKGSGPAGTKIPARTSTVTPCQVAPDPGKFDTALSLPQGKEGELRATVEPPYQSASVGDDPLVQHHPPAEEATAAVRAAEAQALDVDSSPEQIKLSTASSEDPRSAIPVPKEEVKASSQQPDGHMEKSGDGDKKASEKSSDQGSSANLVGVQLGVPDDTEVIDWAAAVDQCSGDVSFLEELLVDLWNESNAHMEQLREFIPRGAMRDTQHEAHSIKGAAANLMCHRLRLSALYLERAGQVGTRLQEGSSDFNSVKEDLKKGQQVLERELSLFQDLLKQKKLV